MVSRTERSKGYFPRDRTSARTHRSPPRSPRSEEHTSELQSQSNLVCRLLLEKKKKTMHSVLTSNYYRRSCHRTQLLFLHRTYTHRPSRRSSRRTPRPSPHTRHPQTMSHICDN